MTQNEKDSLLSMLSVSSSWCKEMEARDGAGESVHFGDPAAVAWDLTGSVCRLFGWDRAQQLFVQLERHLLNGKRSGREPDVGIASMVALQEFNDRDETTHEMLLEGIRMIPVWIRGPLDKPAASQTAGGENRSRGEPDQNTAEA